MRGPQVTPAGAATAPSDGYWMVDDQGTIFVFGDAELFRPENGTAA